MFQTSSDCCWPFQGGASFVDPFYYNHVSLFYAVMSVPCSLVIICWERTDLLALLCIVFSCVLSLCHVVWYLIVSIPDLCLPLYLRYIALYQSETQCHVINIFMLYCGLFSLPMFVKCSVTNSMHYIIYA